VALERDVLALERNVVALERDVLVLEVDDVALLGSELASGLWQTNDDLANAAIQRSAHRDPRVGGVVWIGRVGRRWTARRDEATVGDVPPAATTAARPHGEARAVSSTRVLRADSSYSLAMSLALCIGCGRHVRAFGVCPFCGEKRAQTPATTRARLARGAAVAAVLGAACGARSDLEPPEDGATDAVADVHCEAPPVPLTAYGIVPLVPDAGCRR